MRSACGGGYLSAFCIEQCIIQFIDKTFFFDMHTSRME